MDNIWAAFYSFQNAVPLSFFFKKYFYITNIVLFKGLFKQI